MFYGLIFWETSVSKCQGHLFIPSLLQQIPTSKADRKSNNKSKGKDSKTNGNKYLSWTFAEAVEIERRFDELTMTF